MVSTRIAPPNSVVLVVGSDDAEIPTSMGSALISASPSCIAVGCLAADDGETEFALGSALEVDPGGQPVFVGTLEAPKHAVAIRSVLGHTILETPVRRTHATVRIWVNHPSEPDAVRVGVD
jgi:hypothetical protein